MRSGRGAANGVLVVALLLAACAEPAIAPAQQDRIQGAPQAPEQADPTRDRLRDQVVQLRETVAGARSALEAAVDADDTPGVRRAVEDAAALLLAEDPQRPAIFPSLSSERDEAGNGDLLTATYSLAREAGGDLGRGVVEVLRDPLAGDLGAWERDAQGMVDAAYEAVTGAESVDDATATVEELPGEGTRALAWMLLARAAAGVPAADTTVAGPPRQTDPGLARAAAERARAHLGVVAVALELLEEQGAPA